MSVSVPILYAPQLSAILWHKYRPAPFDTLLVALILVCRPLLCGGASWILRSLPHGGTWRSAPFGALAPFSWGSLSCAVPAASARRLFVARLHLPWSVGLIGAFPARHLRPLCMGAPSRARAHPRRWLPPEGSVAGRDVRRGLLPPWAAVKVDEAVDEARGCPRSPPRGHHAPLRRSMSRVRPFQARSEVPNHNLTTILV